MVLWGTSRDRWRPGRQRGERVGIHGPAHHRAGLACQRAGDARIGHVLHEDRADVLAADLRRQPGDVAGRGLDVGVDPLGRVELDPVAGAEIAEGVVAGDDLALGRRHRGERPLDPGVLLLDRREIALALRAEQVCAIRGRADQALDNRASVEARHCADLARHEDRAPAGHPRSSAEASPRRSRRPARRCRPRRGSAGPSRRRARARSSPRAWPPGSPGGRRAAARRCGRRRPGGPAPHRDLDRRRSLGPCRPGWKSSRPP